MNRSLKIILITALSFGLYYWLKELYFSAVRSWVNEQIGTLWLSHFITYFIVGMPLLLGVALIHGTRGYLGKLGLDQSVLKGFAFALICTLPMLAGYAALFEFNSEITLTKVMGGAVIAAFIEELFYRGILFGQIYRFTNWGFIPSIILGALLFASGHLYQSQDPGTLVGVFFTTFAGAVLFAWTYVEWQNNLWVPIFLHLLMNLFWMLFSVSDNAFGGQAANIFRALTIFLIIVLTLVYKKRNGLPIAINRTTLWMKKTN